MKKLAIMLFSAFLLASCGSDADNTENTGSNDVEQHEDATTEEVVQEGSEVKDKTLQTLPEYATLTDFIDVNHYTITSQTENKGNRILVFANEEGEKEYKSIFVKNDQRLKIIDLVDDHLLFNDVIAADDSTSKENATEKEDTNKEDTNKEQNDKPQNDTSTNDQNAALEKFDEYETIAKEIDLDHYTGNVQTDNKGTRIIIFANEQGKNEYKSIYVKRQKRLKIVEFHSDHLLFNGVIK